MDSLMSNRPHTDYLGSPRPQWIPWCQIDPIQITWCQINPYRLLGVTSTPKLIKQ
ncbi:hypothetical protein T06_5014, partial [Trichinella sp. T6]